MKVTNINMVTTIKNGQLARRSFVLCRRTKTAERFLRLLWQNGFIVNFKVSSSANGRLQVFLKYSNNVPAIASLKLLSLPGKRVHCSVKELSKLNSTRHLIIVSTSEGLMSLSNCKYARIGGQPVALVA